MASNRNPDTIEIVFFVCEATRIRQSCQARLALAERLTGNKPIFCVAGRLAGAGVCDQPADASYGCAGRHHFASGARSAWSGVACSESLDIPGATHGFGSLVLLLILFEADRMLPVLQQVNLRNNMRLTLLV